MTSKSCTKCKKEKSFNHFYFKNGKSRSICKRCSKKSNKKYRIKNKDKIKKYYIDNRELKIEKSRNRYSNNKDAILNKQKEYRVKNYEDLKLKRLEYYENNKDIILERQREYYIKNKSVIIKRNNMYQSHRVNLDIQFKIKKNISRAISGYMHKCKGGKSILNYLPFSMLELKEHLESQFEDWMNWNNYGCYKVNCWDNNDKLTWVWNIDHIVPHSKFCYSTMKDIEFKRCWALSNLRPYSAKQNLLDGNRRGE